MAIPKIIHYCWFGNKTKPNDIVKCMNTWERLNDYKIIEWNESNIDIKSHNYMKNNYERGKYAFVSDYVRLKVLYDFGGIYLDTDVEVKKSFNQLLDNKFFIGFMYNCNLGTAVIGSEKNNNLLKNMLSKYDNMEVNDYPNNDIFTRYFLENYPEFKLNNKLQKLNNEIIVYPKEYFERPTFNKSMGYSIHNYKGSWNNSANECVLKKSAKLILGKVLYSKLSHYRALKKSPFYNIYINHNRKGNKNI